MKIRIMHILYSFDIGGLENNIVNLINRMDRGRFSHSICIFSDRMAALQKIEIKDVKVFIVKRKFANDPTLIFRLARLLRNEHPDIVGTYNWGAIEGIPAARLAGVKRVVHSEHGFDLEEIYRKKLRRIFVRRFLLKKCDKIIAVSRLIKRWLMETVKIAEDRIVYVPNGCDLKIFYPGKDMERRRSLGIEDRDIVIGSVGGLKEIKGYDLLIAAFTKIAKERDDLKLLLVGDGPQKERLKKLAEEAGVAEKIIFTGEIIETAPFYRAMDIFVLSSLAENFPIALLEAMATGLPIVATDAGDAGYMLDAGAGGLLVTTKDAAAIAKGVEYLLNDRTEAVKKGGIARKRVEELFSLDRMTGAYESLYLTVSGQRG
ncbi:MAG: glycosyltransferase [Candidatus Omnitrophica bacterium]|nr:glycosyltransferase [Candidatus Omnitrophota bacterium]